MDPIDDLGRKLGKIVKEAKEGKVISTNLTADEKPSRFKMIALSIATFGIYYGIYHYQHNKERVFKKITSEIEKSLKDYQLGPKHVLSGDSLDLEWENETLIELQRFIADADKEVSRQDFQDHNTTIKQAFTELHKSLLDKKLPELRKEIKKQQIARYQQAEVSPINRILLEALQRIELDQIVFNRPDKNNQSSWKILDSQKRKVLLEGRDEGKVDFPKITNREILELIEEKIKNNSSQLSKQDLKDQLERPEKKVEDLIKKVAELAVIWRNNDPNKVNDPHKAFEEMRRQGELINLKEKLLRK
ncbi:hypothetical protein PHSC3_001772 [Chlamydiales bacterium STE3]|nr:hypothetical protein PHSC3_001772 [Chlamydiales bacterium STE3]